MEPIFLDGASLLRTPFLTKILLLDVPRRAPFRGAKILRRDRKKKSFTKFFLWREEKNLDDLKKFLTMPRSLWKGPFIDSFLLKQSKKLAPNSLSGETKLSSLPSQSSESLPSRSRTTSLRKIKVWSRRSLIIPDFIHQFFEVHNGKTFISLQVNEDMIGHKFGEFASTRKKTLHKKKLKK